MKPVNAKWSTYIDPSKEINEKGLKFKIGDTVRILKNKNILQKSMLQIRLKKFLWLKKAVPWRYVINDLKDEKIDAMFYKKELWKTNHKEFRIQKVIKRKDNKLYVKWKGYKQ